MLCDYFIDRLLTPGTATHDNLNQAAHIGTITLIQVHNPPRNTCVLNQFLKGYRQTKALRWTFGRGCQSGLKHWRADFSLLPRG